MTFDDYGDRPSSPRPIASGFCPCGARLPLGAWPHAWCPGCLARKDSRREMLWYDDMPEPSKGDAVRDALATLLALAGVALVLGMLGYAQLF